MKTYTEFMSQEPSSLSTVFRRDIDIRPLYLFVGLKKGIGLTEVYNGGKFHDLILSEHEQSKIHKKLGKVYEPGDFVVREYTGSFGQTLNHSLLENHVSGKPIPEQHQQKIDAITSRLHPVVHIDSPVNLYTGLPKSPVSLAGSEWTNERSHKLIRFPTFTSTSTNADVAASFTDIDTESEHHESDHHGIVLPNARHVLQLNFTNKIHNVLSVAHDISMNPHEQEVLLGHHQEFLLHPRPTLYDGFEHPVYVWKATRHLRHTY